MDPVRTLLLGIAALQQELVGATQRVMKRGLPAGLQPISWNEHSAS